jgi:CRP-like cAMP-binding protein
MSGVFIFANLGFDEARLAMPYFQKRAYKSGETIFKDGDKGESMCIIESGKVAVLKGEVQIAAIVPGNPFGELSLLDGKPRSATCKADADTVMYFIDDTQLRKLTADHPAIGAKIYRAVGFSLAARMRRANSQLTDLLWGVDGTAR